MEDHEEWLFGGELVCKELPVTRGYWNELQIDGNRDLLIDND